MSSVRLPLMGRVSFFFFSFLCAVPAHAAEQVLPAVVISATRLPTPAKQVASSVTVISAADIERKQYRTLPDILQEVPGLHVVQNGGVGSTTAVFMRGANANHTKVLLDGIDISDPTSTNNAFDYSQIMASAVDRIEVLRGPQSGLYGSDSIGGVINIYTKKGKGPATVSGYAQGGSFSTFNKAAGVSGSTGRFDYTLNAVQHRSGGMTVTPSALVPTGRPRLDDSWENRHYTAKLGAALTDAFDVGLVGHYVDYSLRSTTDDFTGPQATRTESDNHNLFTRATAHALMWDGRMEHTLGVGYADYQRRTLDPAVSATIPSHFNGSRVNVDWQGSMKVTEGQTVVLGAEHQHEKVEDLAGAKVSNNAAFAEVQSAFTDSLFSTVSIRHDRHGRFGGKTTYRVAPTYSIPATGTKLKASYGTGFKAPSLDQLYHDYPGFGFFANRNLKPETSRGYDVGFEQSLWDDRVQFGSSYFENDIRNLITFNGSFTSNINIGKAETHGLESFVSVQPTKTVTLRADHTLTIAQNAVTKETLLRRPRHKASASATWKATERLNLNGAVVYDGSWVDVSRSGLSSGLRPSGYTVVNLSGDYDVGGGMAVYGRIDNALDKRYENPVGFQHTGFGAYVGIRFSLNPELPR